MNLLSQMKILKLSRCLLNLPKGSTEDSDTTIKAMEDIKTLEASEAETKKDAKEVVTKTDEIPMEDINIKDTNATKIQDFSTKMKTIDNDNTISMDVAATKDTKEADEETKITFKMTCNWADFNKAFTIDSKSGTGLVSYLAITKCDRGEPDGDEL